MSRRRLKPLVWPFALLVAGGLVALLAELMARSADAMALYGMVRMVSDLTLAIGAVWLLVGIVSVFRHQ